MVDLITVETSALDDLNSKVEALGGRLNDLRPLFEQYSSDFYKDEKRIFSLKGAGQYEDLSDNYKTAKRKKRGFIYPMLFDTGRTAASLLSRNARDSINIIKKREFQIGTSVPYAVYHHSEKPRSKMPRRPVYFFGDDNLPLNKRWARTTNAWLNKITKDTIDG